MQSYEQILNFALIAGILMIAVHVLFRNVTIYEPEESFEVESEINMTLPSEEVIEPYVEDIFRPDAYRSEPQPVENVSFLDFYGDNQIQGCPVKENELQIFKYTKNNIIARADPQVPQCTKDFHDDFFSFRDKTFANSSMTVDPVDKINMLYLSDNHDEVRGYPKGFRIKDFYDSLTDGGIFSKRHCVRVPDFEGNQDMGDNRVNYH